MFSALLNTNGRIGDLLINSRDCFTFIAPAFLRSEIRSHYAKISTLSGLSKKAIQEAEYHLYKNITFISEEQILLSNWLTADALVADIDPKDTHYIAYALQFQCAIWSGDKKLVNGLAAKGFTSFITIDEMYRIREDMRSKG